MQELVIRQLRRNEAAWAPVRADLALLAEGTVKPAQLNDAGPFLYRASALAETISSVEQSEIESFRLAHGHLDNDAKARALELLARFDRGIVQEAYEGSLRGRARFGSSFAFRAGHRGDDMFVGMLQPGINGAVRIMLAAAIASATKVDGGAVADATDQAPQPQELAMLRREVEIMGSMRHPNCVSFYGACFEPGFTGRIAPHASAFTRCALTPECSNHHGAGCEGQHARAVGAAASAPEASLEDGSRHCSRHLVHAQAGHHTQGHQVAQSAHH
jgi:hypothetical protein